MKLHVLRKAPLSFLLLLAVLLLLWVGCDSAGSGDGGGSGVGATDVPEVQLSGGVSTDDFADSTVYHNLPNSKEEALEAVLYAMDMLSSAVEEFAMVNEEWEPDGTFEASPQDFSSWPDAGNVSLSFDVPTQTIDLSSNDSGMSGTITAAGSGSFTAEIDFIETAYDSDLDWFSGRATLDESSLELDSVADPVYYSDVTIPAGKILLLAGANAQVDPEWQNVDGWLEPERIDAAAGLSIHVRSALSIADADDSGMTFGGNYLVEAKYTDSADLRITKSMLEDDAELETYLENNLDLGEFSMTISVYNNSGSVEKGPYDYSLEELVDFGQTY
ncbi:MAG: hypothetical protein ACOC25_00805 [Alkalispirochaetaceae bacterium]